jgi:hypothetical protein
VAVSAAHLLLSASQCAISMRPLPPQKVRLYSISSRPTVKKSPNRVVACYDQHEQAEAMPLLHFTSASSCDVRPRREIEAMLMPRQ